MLTKRQQAERKIFHWEIPGCTELEMTMSEGQLKFIGLETKRGKAERVWT